MKIANCIEDINESIGEILVKHFPEIKSGDIGIQEDWEFQESLEKYVKHWIGNNRQPLGAIWFHQVLLGLERLARTNGENK